MMRRSYNNDLRWCAICPVVAVWDPLDRRNAEHFALSCSLLLSFQITPFFSTPRLFTIKKEFPENPVRKKMEHAFLVVPAENFREQRNIWKGSPVFPDGIFQTEIWVYLCKTIFDTSFRPSRSFFGKWNWFVQMVNAIPGRNLPVLNFEHHLPKPWTDWFAHIKSKQTILTTSTSCF